MHARLLVINGEHRACAAEACLHLVEVRGGLGLELG